MLLDDSRPQAAMAYAILALVAEQRRTNELLAKMIPTSHANTEEESPLEWGNDYEESETARTCFGCGRLRDECTCVCPDCGLLEREGEHKGCVPF
jgi:hypothetical protein